MTKESCAALIFAAISAQVEMLLVKQAPRSDLPTAEIAQQAKDLIDLVEGPLLALASQSTLVKFLSQADCFLEHDRFKLHPPL